MNREVWLNKAVKHIRADFKKAGSPLPSNVRVAAGMMSGGRRSNAIGECWGSDASADAGREIWVRPDQTDSVSVLGTLVHELCHAALPDGTGHKAAFATLGKAMLLSGKPTQMGHGSEEFSARWAKFVASNGEYPQPKFLGMQTKKKQTTRMVKVECVECSMVFRTATKWMRDDLSCPSCGGDTI